MNWCCDLSDGITMVYINVYHGWRMKMCGQQNLISLTPFHLDRCAVRTTYCAYMCACVHMLWWNSIFIHRLCHMKMHETVFFFTQYKLVIDALMLSYCENLKLPCDCDTTLADFTFGERICDFPLHHQASISTPVYNRYPTHDEIHLDIHRVCMRTAFIASSIKIGFKWAKFNRMYKYSIWNSRRKEKPEQNLTAEKRFRKHSYDRMLGHHYFVAVMKFDVYQICVLQSE